MALNKLQALKLTQLLNQSIKNPETSLKYRNQFTLLTSVVLSAQCTDTNVNNVTKNIYNKYYTPEHFANLGITKIKRMIKSIGLFNMKAKNLYNLSKILVEKYQSRVPNNFEDFLFYLKKIFLLIYLNFCLYLLQQHLPAYKQCQMDNLS